MFMAQLLVSLNLRYDIVHVSEDTPLYRIGTVLGQHQTSFLNVHFEFPEEKRHSTVPCFSQVQARHRTAQSGVSSAFMVKNAIKRTRIGTFVYMGPDSTFIGNLNSSGFALCFGESINLT
jgi:hypothetical protein